MPAVCIRPSWNLLVAGYDVGMSKRKNVDDYEVVPFTDLDEFRQFLGPLAEGYNDVQLRQLRDEMRIMAEILVDYYILERKGLRF